MSILKYLYPLTEAEAKFDPDSLGYYPWFLFQVEYYMFELSIKLYNT